MIVSNGSSNSSLSPLRHRDSQTKAQDCEQTLKHWERQKWLVIYTAMVAPRPAKDIAKHIGVSKGFVRQVIQHYNRRGEPGLLSVGKEGRRNCYLSWSEEKQLIENFKAKAVKGHIATAQEIKNAYEEIGHQVHKTTIYRLLYRHQWHKIVTLSKSSSKRPSSSRRI